MLIAFACSKASDDDNPNPEPQPQPQPELKGNYVMYEGKAKPVLAAEYRNTGNDNLRLYFYVSQDRKERVVCNLNAALHSDALIDLSKKEKKHDGQAYWGITYYNAESEQLLNAWGYPDDGFTLFDSGTLDIKGSLTLSPTLTLTKGSLKGTDGKDHTFAMHYQGPLTKVEDTKPDPTDTQAPHAGRLNSVQVVSQDKAIVRWNPASDDKTPEEKLRYVVCWKEKRNNISHSSGEPKENILSYEITTKLEKNILYEVWVEVYDQADNIGKSNTEEFSYYYDEESPQVGTIEITDITINSAMVKWTPATDNKTPQEKLSYTLFWINTYTGEKNSKEFSPGSELSYKLTPLKDNTLYRVWVKVRDENGNEASYDSKNFETLKDEDTEAPKIDNFKVNAGSQAADASAVWSAAGDNKTPLNKILYTVFWQKEGSSEIKSSGYLRGIYEYKFTDLEEGSSYSVWLTARDEAGNEATSPKEKIITHTTVNDKLSFKNTSWLTNGEVTLNSARCYEKDGKYVFCFYSFSRLSPALEIGINKKDLGKMIVMTETKSLSWYWRINLEGKEFYGRSDSFNSNHMHGTIWITSLSNNEYMINFKAHKDPIPNFPEKYHFSFIFKGKILGL